MRNFLFLIGFLLICYSLSAQQKESEVVFSLVRQQLDSLVRLEEQSQKEQIVARITENINKVPFSGLEPIMRRICRLASQQRVDEKLYFKLLNGASTSLYGKGGGKESIELLESLVQDFLPPASTLLLAILNDWRSRNYEYLNNLPTAIQYSEASLKGFEELNEYGSTANSYAHIAILYSKTGQFRKSVEWHRRGLAYAQKNHIPVWISLMSGNLGSALLKVGDTVEALKYLHIDLKTGTALKMYGSVSNTWMLLAKIARKRGQWELWKASLDSSERYAFLSWPKGAAFERIFYELYQQLADWYRMKGDFNQSFHYQNLYFENKRGHDSIENLKYSSQLLLKLEREYQQKEIDSLQSDIKQKAYLNRLYGVLVITLVLLLGLILYSLDFQRRRRIVEKETNARLESLNQLKDRMFSVISHDMRAPLASLSGLLELFNQSELTAQEKEYFLEEVKNQLGASMNLLDNLLQWSMLQFQGNSQPEFASINLYEEVESLLPVIHGQAKRKRIRILNKIPPKLSVMVDRNHLQLILRNLISNALKFSHFDSEVILFAERLDTQIRLNVSDKGVGMPPDVLNSLFKLNTYHTTFGTGGEKGAGLGLSLCLDYATINKGKLEVSSTEGKGSTFSLYLPLS